MTTATAVEFEVGKLYQVYCNKKWIIAEYVKTVEAHSYKYHDMNMATFRIGSEKIRNVPTEHYWRAVVGSSLRTTVAKDTQTRPVTDETLGEIVRLKLAIKQVDLDRVALLNELRDLTL